MQILLKQEMWWMQPLRRYELFIFYSIQKVQPIWLFNYQNLRAHLIDLKKQNYKFYHMMFASQIPKISTAKCALLSKDKRSTLSCTMGYLQKPKFKLNELINISHTDSSLYRSPIEALGPDFQQKNVCCKPDIVVSVTILIT